MTASSAQPLERRVVMRVGPADVDERQDPRDDDDEGAEKDAETETWGDEPAGQRLVKGDQQDETEIDDHHRDGQCDGDAPPGCGNGLEAHAPECTHERPTPQCG